MENEHVDDHLPAARGSGKAASAGKRAPQTPAAVRPSGRLGDRALFACGGLLLGFAAAYLYLDQAAPPPQRAAVDPHAGVPGMGGMPGMPPGGGDPGASAGAPAGPAIDPATVQRMRELEQAAAKTPANYDVWVQLGNAAYDSNEPARAVNAYEKALAIKPGDVNVMTDLGVSYRNVGNVDRALATFDAVLKAQPEHWQALFNQVVVYAFDKKDLPKARELFAKLKKGHPELPMLDKLGKELEGGGGPAPK